MAFWTCTARVTERCEITIEAETEEDALKKFNALNWGDDWPDRCEIVDWEVVGKFHKDEE